MSNMAVSRYFFFSNFTIIFIARCTCSIVPCFALNPNWWSGLIRFELTSFFHRAFKVQEEAIVVGTMKVPLGIFKTFEQFAIVLTVMKSIVAGESHYVP